MYDNCPSNIYKFTDFEARYFARYKEAPEIIKYLQSRGLQIDLNIIEMLIAYNHSELAIEMLNSYDCSTNNKITLYINSCDLNVFRLLLEKNYKITLGVLEIDDVYHVESDLKSESSHGSCTYRYEEETYLNFTFNFSNVNMYTNFIDEIIECKMKISVIHWNELIKNSTVDNMYFIGYLYHTDVLNLEQLTQLSNVYTLYSVKLFLSTLI
jgi:hypothetical protein